MGQNSSKTLVLAVVAAVALVVGTGLWMRSNQAAAPSSTDDNTASIEKDLNSIDVGSADADLKTTDADVNSL